MVWNPGVFFPAFKRAGMLAQAVYKPAGVATPFDADWVSPEALILGDQAQTVDYRLEYLTTAVPRLKVGDAISVNGVLYTVRAAPMLQEDGTFSHVELSEGA